MLQANEIEHIRSKIHSPLKLVGNLFGQADKQCYISLKLKHLGPGVSKYSLLVQFDFPDIYSASINKSDGLPVTEMSTKYI